MSTLRPPSVLIDGAEEDLPGLSPVPSPSTTSHHETKSLNSSFSESSEADMLTSIDASLSLFQLTPSPPIDFNTIPSSTRTPIISLLYCLLSDRTHHDKSLSTLRSTLETTQREMGHLQMRYDDAKEEAKESEKKLWETEMRRRGLEKDSLENEKKLKSEITRLTTKCRMIQSRDNQYRHELRKRELEYEKLQDRLTKLMQDRSKENSKWGMELLNQAKLGTTIGNNTALMTSQKINRGRGVEGKKTDNIDLITQQHLSNEERMQEIVAENQQLRESFRQLYAKVETAIDSLPAHTIPPAHASPPSPSTLLPAHFDMPFEFIRSSLESSMEQRVAIIERAREIAEEQHRLEQEQGTDPEILEKWKKHCAEQSSIIQHQDTLLRSSLFADDHFNPLDEDDRRWSAESEEITHLKAATHVNAAANAMAHTITSTPPKHSRTRSEVVSGTCASLGIDEQDRLSHYHRLLNSGSKKWAQSMLNDMNPNASMSISSALTPTAATASAAAVPPHHTHSQPTNTPSRYTTPKRMSVVHSTYTPYDAIDPDGLSPRTRALLKTPYLSPPPAELSSMSPLLKSYASRDEPDAIDDTMKHLTEEQSSGTANVRVST